MQTFYPFCYDQNHLDIRKTIWHFDGVTKRFLYLIPIFLLLGCSEQNRPIGIMGALDAEISLLKEGMDARREEVLAGRIFNMGRLHGEDLILVRAGVGKANATLTTQILIEEYGIRSFDL